MLEFIYRGKTYEIIKEEVDCDSQPNAAERILSDFEYCLEKRDYTTIENRIINGTTWGWLKEK
jgi:hypothetical protein